MRACISLVYTRRKPTLHYAYDVSHDTTKVVYVTDGRADRIDPIAPVPPYRQIADILRRRIASGKYQPDTRIPTESELVEEFEVARPRRGARWACCARKG